jgi:Na+/melibiose symporter-like transporter
MAAVEGTAAPARKNPFELVLFAAPAAPLMALSLPPIIFLPPYYSQHLGLDVGLVGLLFVAARAFDILVNPMIGSLQDGTRSAFGRRKLWMAIACPILMAIVYVAFIGLQPGVAALVVGLVILSLYSTFAAMLIAHLGWAGALRPDYDGRTRVLGAVQIASTLGQLLVLTLPAIVQTAGIGDFVDGVHIMGWSIIIALPAMTALTLLTVPEPPPGAQPSEKQSLTAAFEAMRANHTLRRLLVPDFLLGIVQGVSGSLFIFFVQHQMGFPKQAELLLLIYFLAGLFGAPLWIWLGQKWGKDRALAFSCVWWAIGFLMIPFGPKGEFAIAAATVAFAGLAQAAGTMLLRAMMADVADENELLTDRQQAGLFFGLLLTTTKVGLALGPLSYAVLGLFGFDPKLGAGNSADAMLALTIMFVAVPGLFNLATAWSLRNYPLNAARHREVRAALDARRAT